MYIYTFVADMGLERGFTSDVSRSQGHLIATD